MKVEEFNSGSKLEKLTPEDRGTLKFILDKLEYSKGSEPLIQYTYEPEDSVENLSVLSLLIALAEIGWSEYADALKFPAKCTMKESISENEIVYGFEDAAGLRLLLIKSEECNYDNYIRHRKSNPGEYEWEGQHPEVHQTYSIITTAKYLDYFMENNQLN